MSSKTPSRDLAVKLSNSGSKKRKQDEKSSPSSSSEKETPKQKKMRTLDAFLVKSSKDTKSEVKEEEEKRQATSPENVRVAPGESSVTVDLELSPSKETEECSSVAEKQESPQKNKLEDAVSPKQKTELGDADPPKQNNKPEDAVSPKQKTEVGDAVPPKQKKELEDAASPKQNNKPEDAISRKQNNKPEDAVSPKQKDGLAATESFQTPNSKTPQKNDTSIPSNDESGNLDSSIASSVGETSLNSIDEKEGLGSATTPKASSAGKIKKKINSAKREAERLERQKKREEEQREKEKKREEQERLKREKKEAKEKEKREKEEAKEKERKEKEEKKEKERMEKERERKEREEKKEREKEERERERLEKEREKAERAERKERERLEKEEEKRRKEEEERQKAEKRKEAFQKFFVKKGSSATTAPTQQQNESNDSNQGTKFLQFEVQKGTVLAPLRRLDFSENQKRRLDAILTDEGSPEKKTNYLLSLKKEGGRTYSRTLQPSEEDDDVVILSEEDKDTFLISGLPRVKRKYKLLQFEENHRPAYWGTWRKRSGFVGGRKPFAKDQQLDYEVDSDEEWEEEPDGESLSGSEKEKESEDEYEIDNDFFVPHGYLSDEEIEKDEDGHEVEDPEEAKMKLKLKLAEFEEELKRKKTKLQPRAIGCCFFDTGKISELLNKFMAVRIQFEGMSDEKMNVWEKEGIPVLPTEEAKDAEEEGGGGGTNGSEVETTGGRIKKLPRDLQIALVRFAHGNPQKRKKIASQFFEQLSEEVQQTVSFRACMLFIRHHAEYNKPPKNCPWKKLCWIFSERVLQELELVSEDREYDWSHLPEDAKTLVGAAETAAAAGASESETRSAERKLKKIFRPLKEGESLVLPAPPPKRVSSTPPSKTSRAEVDVVDLCTPEKQTTTEGTVCLQQKKESVKRIDRFFKTKPSQDKEENLSKQESEKPVSTAQTLHKYLSGGEKGCRKPPGPPPPLPRSSEEEQDEEEVVVIPPETKPSQRISKFFTATTKPPKRATLTTLISPSPKTPAEEQEVLKKSQEGKEALKKSQEGKRATLFSLPPKTSTTTPASATDVDMKAQD